VFQKGLFLVNRPRTGKVLFRRMFGSSCYPADTERLQHDQVAEGKERTEIRSDGWKERHVQIHLHCRDQSRQNLVAALGSLIWRGGVFKPYPSREPPSKVEASTSQMRLVLRFSMGSLSDKGASLICRCHRFSETCCRLNSEGPRG
jgi:hypothetical protein